MKTVIFCWGNLSRGDDALGPLMAERLERWLQALAQPPCIELVSDYQLQVEHTLDMQNAGAVWFVDASLDATAPFSISTVRARKDASYSSHAMTPDALLAAFEQLEQRPAPTAQLMAIRGYAFGLGASLSPQAQGHLESAYQALVSRLL